MRTTRLTGLAALAAGVAISAAACSGGQDSGEDSSPADDGQQQSSAPADSSDGSDSGGSDGSDSDASDSGSDGADDAGGSDSDSGSETVSEQPAADTDLRKKTLPVSAQDAIEKAQDAVGTDGTLHAVELDYDEDASAWQWDVKILDGTTDHKIEIDAVSGKIVTKEKESTDDTEKAIDLQDPLTFEDALKLATDEVDGPLHGWKYEWDDGQREYQFDIGTGNGDDTEVTVNAETQKVTVDS